MLLDQEMCLFWKEKLVGLHSACSNIAILTALLGDTQQFPIKYKLQSNSTSVCITCTFLDNSATDCVAVVHQRISQLSSSGLMNIESSHKFTRSGDTASGCIDGVNLEDYHVGVIVGTRQSTKQTSMLLTMRYNSQLMQPSHIYHLQSHQHFVYGVLLVQVSQLLAYNLVSDIPLSYVVMAFVFFIQLCFQQL